MACCAASRPGFRPQEPVQRFLAPGGARSTPRTQKATPWPFLAARGGFFSAKSRVSAFFSQFRGACPDRGPQLGIGEARCNHLGFFIPSVDFGAARL